MPIHDYICPVCKVTLEVHRTFEEAEQDLPRYCPYCMRGSDVMMVRQPAAPAFTVSGYSAKNGYSSE